MAITKYSLRRPTHSAWNDFDDMSNRLSRLFDTRGPNLERGWSPAVSASENADALEFVVELPGMRDEDISVELDNGVLTISGEKTETRTEGEDERYYLYERSFGSFSRSFTLPRTIDGANVEATFENGILTVTLPKAAEAKGRKIEIRK